jgi:hypothetical protein
LDGLVDVRARSPWAGRLRSLRMSLCRRVCPSARSGARYLVVGAARGSHGCVIHGVSGAWVADVGRGLAGG